ncbi:ATP synthase subunit b mitochondrial [Trichostrongylus colubriformis]|uniref:ATP synthase subunit b n=1 Tax=Trichostrongylus colubriformis TaxID=6319 RepID=A0AAN8FHV8_TRICO
MSLSRILPAGKNARFVIVSLRCAHNTAQAGAAHHVEVQVEDDKPSFFQKIALRFQGIPLKGEHHPPKSIFSDCGKEWFAPKPLPEVPKDYKEHPDRDLVNYPYPARPMYPPKTRLLMMPDSWFTPFHKVTGVSGPYLFFGGLFAFLLNKEIWVFEEQGHMTVGWILFYLLISRTVGYRIDNYLYGEYQKEMDYYRGLIAEDLKDAVEFRKTAAAETASLNAVKESFPLIMKENMLLQLEATYRKNVQSVATELKRRLDYLKETEETKRRFEKEQMLKFISEGVEKEASEKAFKDKYLQNAIQTLKGLQVQV